MFINFRFKVRHDNGIVYITVPASSLESARKTLLDTERCPERSILDVRAVNEKGFEIVPSGEYVGQLMRLEIPASRVLRGNAPLSRSRTGYGSKIPTSYKVRTIDDKWRRVYCAIYPNVGTLYVMHEGVKTIINFWGE